MYLLSTYILRGLLEAKLKKNNGLISLVEEISRQPNIDSVMWVLAIMWIFNENKRNRDRKKSKQIVWKGRGYRLV